MRATLVALTTLVLSASTPPAAAEPVPAKGGGDSAPPAALAPPERAVEAMPTVSLDRPHTRVELGIGALTVPSGNLCIATQCTTTDLTLLVALRHFLRWNRKWALGAGVSWGFRPNKEDATTSVDSAGLPINRQHTRNYFMLSGSGRYFPVATDRFDVWTGVTSGVVVASDRYASTDTGGSILGPKANSISTEGLMLGVGMGVDWVFGQSWSAGVWTNEMLWRFPRVRECAQTRECASVAGSVFSFETGINVTYRVRL